MCSAFATIGGDARPRTEMSTKILRWATRDKHRAEANDVRLQEDATYPKTYVLVHGSFFGGWCWKGVAGGLRALGHSVYTPTLTGLGERSHLLAARPTLRRSLKM